MGPRKSTTPKKLPMPEPVEEGREPPGVETDEEYDGDESSEEEKEEELVRYQFMLVGGGNCDKYYPACRIRKPSRKKESSSLISLVLDLSSQVLNMRTCATTLSSSENLGMGAFERVTHLTELNAAR